MSLSDIKKNSIKMEVDNVVYYLRFDLNALALLEDEFGTIDDAFKFTEGDKSINKMISILCAALKSNHGLSREEVGELFTVDNMGAFEEAMAAAFGESMPPDKGEEKNLKAPKAKTKK